MFKWWTRSSSLLFRFITCQCFSFSLLSVWTCYSCCHKPVISVTETPTRHPPLTAALQITSFTHRLFALWSLVSTLRCPPFTLAPDQSDQAKLWQLHTEVWGFLQSCSALQPEMMSVVGEWVGLAGGSWVKEIDMAHCNTCGPETTPLFAQRAF